MHSSKLMICLLSATALFGEIVPLTGESGKRNNEHLISRRQVPGKVASGAARASIAFSGDNVIPHIVDGVDGGSWSSAITLTNLDIRTVTVTVYFLRDDGSDLVLPVTGLGNVVGVRATLAPAATVTFGTTGVGAISTGWAYIAKESVIDAISGFCVLRRSTPGLPDSETVLPFVNQFDQRAVLLYDNTNGFVAAAAFANLNPSRASLTLTVRTEDGTVLERNSFTLEPYSHWMGPIANLLPSTGGRRGSIELTTTGIGVLGLRFNPTGSFTTYNAVTSINWLQ